MSSSFDPLAKSTGGSPPVSATPGTPENPLAPSSTRPAGNGATVDEFGLDSTPSVDTDTRP